MDGFELFPLEKRESTVEYVINTIKKLLLTKRLKPGDMLPSEAALSESLNVSRSSVREAMKILSAFGVVEIRRGNGTYVANPQGKSNIDPFLFNLILSGADAREMVELRELLETQIVTLIIKNASDEAIEALAQIQDEIKQSYGSYASSDRKALVDYDMRFHAALGRATNNVLVEKIYGFVMELFAPYVEKTYDHEANGERAIALHDTIVAAIRARNNSEAIVAIQKSIEEWRKIFHENH